MRRILIGSTALLCLAHIARAETDLKIMSFNIWGGGQNEGKGVAETAAAIKAAGADIIGIQETRLESDPCTADHCPPTGPSAAKALADALGFHYYEQKQDNAALWANAILSRYPIGPATPHDLGVPIDVNGVTVWAFNIHLIDFPYQPYQLLKIEYGPAPYFTTAEEAVAAAKTARGPALDLLFQDMKAADGAAATFVFGDFNEPSTLDWTDAAVKAGQQPVAVRWPSTQSLIDAGFVDTYRAAWPDPVAKPAYTWTARGDEKDPEDHHDRIDFAFARAKDLTVVKAAIVGEQGARSDLVVMPWPSDHRSTMAEIRF